MPGPYDDSVMSKAVADVNAETALFLADLKAVEDYHQACNDPGSPIFPFQALRAAGILEGISVHDRLAELNAQAHAALLPEEDSE